MSDTTELMLDGTLCSQCLAFIDDAADGYVGAYGYPRYCRRCGGDPALNGQREQAGRRRRKRRLCNPDPPPADATAPGPGGAGAARGEGGTDA